MPNTSKSNYTPLQGFVQGAYVQVQLQPPLGPLQSHLLPPKPRKRGMITTFSKRSRRRMIQLLHRLQPCECLFMTLTVADGALPDEVIKRRFRAFLQWIRRHFGRAGWIWRMELQERGVIHYHIALFGVSFIPHQLLERAWRLGYVWIERVPARRLTGYLTKYLSKGGAESEGEGGDSLDPSAISARHLGRWWGYGGDLPFAPIRPIASLPLGWQEYIADWAYFILDWMLQQGAAMPRKFSFCLPIRPP